MTMLPAARSGIMAGIILATGRAIGETMAVIMVAGNQARIPDSILKGVRTLTANIVIEMGYATDLHREALIATGVEPQINELDWSGAEGKRSGFDP